MPEMTAEVDQLGPVVPPVCVVAFATFESAETPTVLVLNARNRAKYFVFAIRPITRYDVSFAATVVSNNGEKVLLIDHSILNPSSLFELSAHERPIVELETGVADSAVGAAGGDGAALVDTTDSFDGNDAPAPFTAFTR